VWRALILFSGGGSDRFIQATGQRLAGSGSQQSSGLAVAAQVKPEAALAVNKRIRDI